MSAAVKGKSARRGAPAHPHLQGHDVDPRGHSGLTGGDGARSSRATEAIDLDELGELAALQGVVKFPVRIKCATSSWNARPRASTRWRPKPPEFLLQAADHQRLFLVRDLYDDVRTRCYYTVVAIGDAVHRVRAVWH